MSLVNNQGYYSDSDNQSLQHNPSIQSQRGDAATEIKAIFQNFLTRLQYRAPNTAPNARLRADVATEIISWKAGLSSKFIDGLTDTACAIAETALSHTGYAHQRLVSLYTAYIIYIDDLGGRDLETLGRFGQRVAAHESQGDPVLERLAHQFGDMYAMYPQVGADCINAATLAGVAGTHIEYSTEHMAVARGALRYPAFLRGMTGYSTAFAFFNFVQGWRDPEDRFYLQVVPELAFCTDHIKYVV
ncbi:uncharacterized protein TRAVEDRAFT_46870 [Trametes versicolor FP-101664 SS1]|uniref:uncharacterized protein n=1 Tax=Trametes versicolor (strain FP-101664) TaxID=717944 RepID=UPI0004621FD4|nr:uncharacterized protein TRAVEDRAFT_46870 [Trametes versicolor FP-101664 SS1]EIW59568.1 hypothetical protein TRAVEDRAFT_46870 [Trametes versicolor FP-101664 SS1]